MKTKRRERTAPTVARTHPFPRHRHCFPLTCPSAQPTNHAVLPPPHTPLPAPLLLSSLLPLLTSHSISSPDHPLLCSSNPCRVQSRQRRPRLRWVSPSRDADRPVRLPTPAGASSPCCATRPTLLLRLPPACHTTPATVTAPPEPLHHRAAPDGRPAAPRPRCGYGHWSPARRPRLQPL